MFRLEMLSIFKMCFSCLLYRISLESRSSFMFSFLLFYRMLKIDEGFRTGNRFSTNMKTLEVGRVVPFARGTFSPYLSFSPSLTILLLPQAFDFAQKVLLDRILNPFWRFTERFSAKGRQMRESVKIVSDYAYEIIDQRAQLAEEGKKGEQDLLDLYMSIR